MEEIKKIEVQGQQYGVADMLMRSVMGGNAQVIEWSHTHNMNDYKDAGTYRIKGERTGSPLTDNLPIMNSGSGHTIEGVLYVLDSSLTNGSGKEDDCTITQFLMLSNRVGGQDGDMYMRSAYGATKDNLTWKPWEKYQTNMEVGVVSEYKLLNPNNPTEILKHDSGMNHITDNGIYSGIYFGPKCMVGTSEDRYHITFQDATAIETFVMVVINNYAAAGDARCITQVKFAVTNGGVFSMEKRSTTPGTTDTWSEWESVGGSGLPASWAVGDGVTIGTGGAGSNVTIGERVFIGNDMKIKRSESGGYTIGTDATEENNAKLGNKSYLGELAYIGNNVNIGDNVRISDVLISQDLMQTPSLTYEIRSETESGFRTFEIADNTLTYDSVFCEDSDGNPTIRKTTIDHSSYLKISHEITRPDSTYPEAVHMLLCDECIYFDFNIDDTYKTTAIPWGLVIYASDTGLVFKYGGKKAELPFT